MARALLEANEPLSFDDLMAAAPACSPGEVAGWIGHAVSEGLVREMGTEIGTGLKFSLRARGRRLFSARRRQWERTRRGPRGEQLTA